MIEHGLSWLPGLTPSPALFLGAIGFGLVAIAAALGSSALRRRQQRMEAQVFGQLRVAIETKIADQAGRGLVTSEQLAGWHARMDAAEHDRRAPLPARLAVFKAVLDEVRG